MQTLLGFGIRLITALQGLGSWLTLPMNFFSFLGTENFFMLVLPVLYWCVDSSLGIQVALLLMFSTNLNEAFKLALHGPRPYWYSASVDNLASESSFGIPSGHSQSAAVVWGLLAAYLQKWWAWLGAILLIFFIGISRLYLAVHFPQDVLTGWLIGFLLLWLAVRFWQPATRWIKKQTAGRQSLTALLASLVVLLLPVFPYIWLKATNWQAPPAWASYASQAISLQDILTASGAFLGLALGLVWVVHQGGFQTNGRWWQLLLRYLVGVAGVLVLYELKIIFPAGDTLPAYFLRYLRYALIGFWVIGGAPSTFVRLKLSKKTV